MIPYLLNQLIDQNEYQLIEYFNIHYFVFPRDPGNSTQLSSHVLFFITKEECFPSVEVHWKTSAKVS